MPVEGVTKQRLASGQACTSCRKRKNRCDGVRPRCLGCQSRGISCEYPSTLASQLSVEELKSFMEAKLRSMSGGQYQGENLNPDQAQQSLGSLSQSSDPAGLEVLLRATTNVLGNHNGQRPSQSYEAVSFSSTPVRPIVDSVDRAASPASNHSESQEPDGYFGDSSTFAFVSKVRSDSATENDSAAGHKRPRFTSPSTGRNRSDAGENGLTAKEKEAYLALPDDQTAERLINAYFKHVHRLYPFVHEPSFKAEYKLMRNSLRDSRVHCRPSWIALLYLIFAYGCEFCDLVHKDDVLEQQTRFVNRAKGLVYPRMFKEGSLEMVQTLLLLCHYLQGTLELNECWNLVGLMIRTAVGLGLHLNPSKATMTPIENEVRKRVWWGCLVIDRTLSMKFGRPPSIRAADEFEVDLPMNVDDQYITNDQLMPRQQDGRPSTMGFFLQTIKLAHVMDCVLQDLYHPSREISLRRSQRQHSPPGSRETRIFGTTMHLDGKLLSWWHGVPDHLNHEKHAPDGSPYQRQRNVMYIRYLNLRLLLHRQAFLIFCRSDIEDTFHKDVAIASCKCCIATACETIRLIYSQYHRGMLNSLWYNLHYIFTSMGVLLTLQKLDRDKLRALGANYEEQCLDQGMDFLKAAGSSNALAARYVNMLQRLRSPDKHADLNNNIANNHNTNNNNSTLQDNSQVPLMSNPVHAPTTSDGMVPSYTDTPTGNWFIRNHGADEYDGFQYQPIIGSEFMDFNDLLSGTGLPRDLMPVEWVNAGAVL